MEPDDLTNMLVGSVASGKEFGDYWHKASDGWPNESLDPNSKYLDGPYYLGEFLTVDVKGGIGMAVFGQDGKDHTDKRWYRRYTGDMTEVEHEIEWWIDIYKLLPKWPWDK